MELNDAQLEALKTLARNNGAGTVKMISKTLDVSSVYAWRLLQGLAKEGLVEKVEWGLYRLTPSGWRRLEVEE